MAVKESQAFAAWLSCEQNPPISNADSRARRLTQTKRHREALYGRAIEWCARAIEGGAFVCPGSRSVEIPLESPEIA